MAPGHALVFELAVERRPGRYRFDRTTDAGRLADAAAAIAEGGVYTVIERADDRAWAWLTITTETDLELVGLTAAIAPALAEADIPANMLAGYCNDHLLVPHERTDEAIAILKGIEPPTEPAMAPGDVAALSFAAELIAGLSSPGFGELLTLLGRDDGVTDSEIAAAIPGRARSAFGLLATLRDAGVVTAGGEGGKGGGKGGYSFAQERPLPLVAALRRLGAGPLEVPDTVAAYVDNGRVARYPRDADVANVLLGAVATHLGPGAVHTERSITAALATIALEPVELRRRLVDAGIVERTSSGSRYLVRPLP